MSIVKASDSVKAAFDFSVDKFPLAGPDGMTTPWYGLFRSDNGRVVGNGSVTDRYVPHSSDDVMALTEVCRTTQVYKNQNIDLRGKTMVEHIINKFENYGFKKSS